MQWVRIKALVTLCGCVDADYIYGMKTQETLQE
jgi:hypothetical protein